MIPFKYGTQEQYDAQIKDNSALYFISDTKRIYRGEELLAGVSALVVEELPSFASAVEDTVYVYLDGDFATLYVKGQTQLVPISGNVADLSITSLKAFASGLILTSTDDIENADDNALITAGAVKTAIEQATGVWEYLDGIEDESKLYG